MIILTSRCDGADLSAQESEILNKFFREILTNSEAGYVLFDAKPVCIHGFDIEDNFYAETPRHLSSVVLREGGTLIKNLKFKNQNILIHTYNNKDAFVKDCIHILFINKQLFIDVVKDNLSLFQYVLGPEVTPEKLLTKLSDPNEGFHEVLKNDKVLIGIILGFGTQNSLNVSRIENLENSRFSEQLPLSPRISKFNHVPLESKKAVFLNCKQHNEIIKKPSFGHTSTDEERKKLIQKVEVSSQKLENNLPNYIFGHIQDKDSQAQISKLEAIQDKINELLASNEFFQNVLGMIFPDEKISIKSAIDTQIGFNQDETLRLPFLVASNIWNNMDENEGNYLMAFLEGMKLSEDKNELPIAPVTTWDYQTQKKLFEIQKNLQCSDNFFANLNQNENLVCLTPLRLYSSTTKKGNGTKVVPKSKVLVRYSFMYPDGEVLIDTFKSEHPEELDLHETISGFALGVQGMEIGEERELYIHPSLGYGILTALKKGTYLKAKVQLVNVIEKGPNDNFSKVEALNLKKELEDLNIASERDFFELTKSAGLSNGFQIWQHYKKSLFYTLPQILEWINLFASTQVDPDISSWDDQNLINHLHWNLYFKP